MPLGPLTPPATLAEQAGVFPLITRNTVLKFSNPNSFYIHVIAPLVTHLKLFRCHNHLSGIRSFAHCSMLPGCRKAESATNTNAYHLRTKVHVDS